MFTSKNLLGNQYSRKYNLNFDYFKRWSPQMAYLLGYLFAEGNIHVSKARGHRIALQLETTDKKMVALLNQALSYPNPPKFRERKDKKHRQRTYYTAICSKEIANDLEKLGIVPNKNKIMEPPKVPLKYLREFVKGYLKGDGCVKNQKYKNPSSKYVTKKGEIKIYRYNKTYIYPILEFASNSIKFLSQLNEIISPFLKIRPGKIYSKGKESSAYTLRFSLVPTRRILQWLEYKKKKI